MVMSALYCFTSFYYEGTLMSKVAYSNSTATLMMAVLGGLAVIGTVDIVINDLMPDKFTFLHALQFRHLVMMGVPVCFAIQIWSCIEADLSYAVIPYYMVYILMVPLSAFVDVQKRHMKDPEQ